MTSALPQAGSLIIILGAGIAGLAAADTLVRAGYRVRVIERDGKAGGTHRSQSIGDYTFDVGSIFYEENARIFDLAPGLRELCPTVMRRQRRIAPNGSILHYPIEPREFLRQSPLKLAVSMLDLFWSRLTVRADGTLDAISRRRLGSAFFESTGLRSYISRFHHVPPSEIDEAFFFHRMAFIERFTRLGMLARTVTRTLLSSAPVNAATRRPLHVRPREGYEVLFDRIVSRLRAAGVEFVFNEELLALRQEGGLYHLTTTSGACIADTVVSTIPLDTLHQSMFGTASGLVSLDMTTLFVSAAKLDERAGNVLFNFHPDGWWKRATIYSRIYPEAAPEATPDVTPRREYFAVETTIAPGREHDPLATFENFREHMTRLGLASDIVLEGQVKVESCYPLYTPGSGKHLARVLERIAATGIVLVGRQGRFEYLPTSSGVIKRVAQELDAAALLSPSTQMAA